MVSAVFSEGYGGGTSKMAQWVTTLATRLMAEFDPLGHVEEQEG